MADLCGVWYRAGSCILPPSHEGLHLTQEQTEAAQDRADLGATLSLLYDMGRYIEATKELICMVTMESDDKPPSPEIARANHLLARWDQMQARLLLSSATSPCGVPLCDAEECRGGDSENGPPGPMGLYRSVETGVIDD